MYNKSGLSRRDALKVMMNMGVVTMAGGSVIGVRSVFAQHALPSIFAWRDIIGNEGMPVRSIDVEAARNDDKNNQGDLENDHRHVGAGGFSDADVAQPRQQQNKNRGRHIGNRACRFELAIEWRTRQCRRNMYVEMGEKTEEIPGPTDSHS